MCLAVPMRVLEVKGNKALVEQEGVSKQVRVDFIDGLQPGEYVLIHAGFAIERIRPDEAEETLRLIRTFTDAVR